MTAGQLMASLAAHADDEGDTHSHFQAALAQQTPDADDDGSQPPTHKHSKDCALAHAHCCCSAAILTSYEVAIRAEGKLATLPPASVIPYGQQSYPPRRPPRAVA